MEAPADVVRIPDDGEEARAKLFDDIRVLGFGGPIGGAAIDRGQANVERLIDVAVGVGADDALLDVIEHEIDDCERIGAYFFEVVQGLTGHAQLQAGVAAVGVEDLADDFAIGFSHLRRRRGQQARGQKEPVIRVQRIQIM